MKIRSKQRNNETTIDNGDTSETWNNNNGQGRYTPEAGPEATTIDNGDTPEVDNRDILEQEALEQIIPEETTLDFKWGRFFRRGKFVVLYLKLKVQ